jgi:tetratricopeptide (TPR) repeat protein
MKKRNDLFDLIKSMTRQEKRYFKIYASKHKSGEHNCIRLFDAIDATEHYNEKELRRSLNGAKFTRQLGVQKGYLYDLLLRSLREYRSGESAQIRINELLHGVKILYGKGLYSQGLDLATKAGEIAESYEKLPRMLEVINWEITLAFAMSDIPALTHLGEKLRSVQDRLDNLEHYSQILLNMVTSERIAGLADDAESLSVLDAIMSDPLLQDEQQALSIDAGRYFLTIHGINHRRRGEWERAYEYQLRNLRLIESRPGNIADEPRIYVSALIDVIVSSSQLRKYAEAERHIEILESLDIDEAYWKARVFYIVRMHRLFQCRWSHDFPGGAERAREILAALRKHERHIEQENRKVLLYTMTYLLFGDGDYSSAIECINIILNDIQHDIRAELNYPVMIVELMIHYELRHDDLIASSVRSRLRALRGTREYYRLEEFVLLLLGRLVRSAPHERCALFHDARNRLSALAAGNAPLPLTNYIDVDAWIEGRIGGMKYGEVVREKIRRER